MAALHRSLLLVFLIPTLSGGAEFQAEPPMKKEPSKPSPLQLALERGMKPGGDLAAELRKLDDYPIRSRQDALAICQALGQLQLQKRDKNILTSPLHALAGLFQDVESGKVDAFPIMREQGIPQLIRIFDASLKNAGDDDDANDLLFVLKVLAMYGTEEGAVRIVRAARQPLKPDAYMWSVVFSALREGNPRRDFVLDALRDPLPEGFIAVSMLDCANEALRVGERKTHPFDSPAGKRRLRGWLTGRDPERFSYAHSATAALPFISNPERDQLLALAMDHADTSVQMEAAWASAKLGSAAALKVLIRHCLDPNRSVIAQQYLEELGRKDLIPEAVRHPDFQARAQFARWLAHPNELGRPPDEVEIVDQRTLRWPPERKPKPFWLLRYRVRDSDGLRDDDIDCGLVGSVTFCLFSYKLHLRPPEDAYAIHCYWEMERLDLIEEVDVDDPKEHVGLLDQWQGGKLEKVKFLKSAKLAPRLKYPGSLAVLASATRNGEEGWVVLDGPRSAWYPKSEMPADTFHGAVLMVHVGRQLLGFNEAPDRKKYQAAAPRPRSAAEIVQAYEKLLTEAKTGVPHRRKNLLAGGSLGGYFKDYVEARAQTTNRSKADVTIQTYEELLQAIKANEALLGKDAYDSFGILGRNFEHYVQALIGKDRRADVLAIIELFKPHWQHNWGYGTLGEAAFKAGNDKVAEAFLVKLRQGLEEWYRSDEMGLLAECWHRHGRSTDAQQLLVEAMKRLAENKKASASDRQQREDTFQKHRATFLRLFPKSGEAGLEAQGVPKSILP